jgi:hypothetical protein
LYFLAIMQRAVLTIRAWILGTVALGLFSAASCSKDDEEKEPPCDPAVSNCGEGGGGGDGVPPPIECAAETCSALVLPFPDLDPIAPCCTDDNACGLDSSFLAEYGAMFSETCQALDQPGELDSECPKSAPLMRPELMISVTFEGCCRVETGTCGYMLDKLFNLVEIGLGCIESTPFLDGGTALPCTPGAGGEGGTGG